jgi:hypothetical protein
MVPSDSNYKKHISNPNSRKNSPPSYPDQRYQQNKSYFLGTNTRLGNMDQSKLQFGTYKNSSRNKSLSVKPSMLFNNQDSPNKDKNVSMEIFDLGVVDSKNKAILKNMSKTFFLKPDTGDGGARPQRVTTKNFYLAKNIKSSAQGYKKRKPQRNLLAWDSQRLIDPYMLEPSKKHKENAGYLRGSYLNSFLDKQKPHNLNESNI